MTALDGAIAVSLAGALPLAARRGLSDLGERYVPNVADAAGLVAGAIGVGYCAAHGLDAYAILCASLVISSITDIRSGVVLDLVVGVSLALLCVSAWSTGTLPLFASGATAATLVMLAVYVAARGGIGAGDVKLAAVLGAALGVASGLAALALGFVAGGIVAAAVLATGRARRNTAIPFAPYLAIGAALAIAFRSAGLAFW